MRKLFLLYIVLFVAFLAYFAYRFLSRQTIPRVAEPIPAAQVPPEGATPPAQAPTVEYEGKTYAYDLIHVTSPDAITLIANFETRADSATLMEQHGCLQAINGGFYSTDNTPLGLFISDGVTVKNTVTNRLINGFISVLGEQVAISSSPPGATIRWSLQTGPLLISDTSRMPLAIRDDEEARRMLAATSQDGTVYFMTIYDPNGVFLGPLLGDLPAIVERIDAEKNLSIGDAVNLDGGSASAFFSPTTRLSEITPVGSLFCVK